MIKLKEDKYYRTADGRKVGPVRIKETWLPTKWAVWSDGENAYEVVGLLAEDALSTEIISEWVDHYHVFDRSEFSPKLWRDMTPEEKGALLLAHHEGEVIEANEGDGWFEAHPYWAPNSTYRVRPEPVRQQVKLYGEQSYSGYWGFDSGSEPGEYRITFDLVDGEPDCTSIRMERIDD